MHKRKGSTAAGSGLIDSLEQRVLLSYTPTVLYTFASAPVVNTIFPNANGSLTFVDDGGISTEPAAGGTPTTLANFVAGGINDPRGYAFENGAGDIFGSAGSGGTATQPSGAVWELAQGASSLTLLASFDPTTVGAEPSADAMDSSGNIYGYTNLGANGTTPGSIWEYHASTQQITSVALPSSDAGFSGAMVVDGSGNLFGVTEGSSSSPGSVFELAAGSGTVTTVATFSSGQEGTIGNVVMDSAGNIYGVCKNGSVDEFYEVSAANRGTIKPLASLPASSGLTAIDSVGDLFTVGSQLSGGTITDSISELISGNNITHIVATLSNATEGDATYALAINSSSGAIYGATEDGGADGNGALFSLTQGGGGQSAGNLTATIARSTLPASVVAGGTSRGEAIVDVTNNGSTTYSGTDTVDVYASTDGSVDSSSTLIGTVTRRVGIRAGRLAPVVVPIRSLPATLDGNYTLLAQVTDTAGNSATSATGPSLTAAAPFISFSDTIIRTTLAPSDVSGQKTRASVQLKITNGGNIVSSGKSTIALYASVDTTPTDGTLIRSVVEPVVLKPGASRVVTIPLSALPDVANNAYFVDAQVTDPKGDITTAASAGTYALASPFVALAPAVDAFQITGPAGSPTGANATFTITNNGNIAQPGLSTLNLYGSTDGTLATGTLAFTEKVNLASIAPGKARNIRIHLNRTQLAAIANSVYGVIQVIDPLGNSETATAHLE